MALLSIKDIDNSIKTMPLQGSSQSVMQDDLSSQGSSFTQSDSFAQDSHVTHNDSKALDYLNVIIGFGLCRAWIVLCLLAPLIAGKDSLLNGIYLGAGAVSALMVALLVKRLYVNLEAMRINFYRLTGVLLIVSAIVMPPAIIWRIEILIIIGIVIGGLGAGLLQVLWGEHFSMNEVTFATVVSPAAAILTAILVALSMTGAVAQTSPLSYFVFPLLSFSMLIFKAYRNDARYGTTKTTNKASTMPTVVTTAVADKTAVPGSKIQRPSEPVKDQTGDLSDSLGNISNENTKLNATGKFSNDSATVPLSTQLIKLLFSVMMFSILCRIFDTLPHSQQDPFFVFGGSPVFSLVIVGSVFLVFAIVLKRRFNPTLTYRLSLPIMVAGFVAIALLYELQVPLSILLINIGYEFFDILAWILFADIARRKTIHPLRVFSFGVAFMFTGMAVGNFAGSIISSMITGGNLQITAVALLCTLSLAVIAFLILPEGTLNQLTSVVNLDKKDKRTQEDTQNSNGLDNAIQSDENEQSGQSNPNAVETANGDQARKLEINCTFVAKAYRLTPRETEILVLLAYGRTAAIIARDFTIASGTARTHCERIYRKLGVHKQQELIDLVENFDSD